MKVVLEGKTGFGGVLKDYFLKHSFLKE